MTPTTPMTPDEREDAVVTCKLGPYVLGPAGNNLGVYQGDARELARAIPDGSIDLAFTDPPYGVGFKYESGISDDSMDWGSPGWLVAESLRVAQVCLITPGIINMWSYPRPGWIMGWFKPGSTGRSMVLNGFNTWEPILVYGKPKRRVYQDSYYLPSVSNLGSKSANFHGCPKPVGLMLRLIEHFTSPGDIVLDLMVGSGTTAIAAKMLGRKWLTFEISPRTVILTRERIRLTQPPLPGLANEQLSFSTRKITNESP